MVETEVALEDLTAADIQDTGAGVTLVLVRFKTNPNPLWFTHCFNPALMQSKNALFTTDPPQLVPTATGKGALQFRVGKGMAKAKHQAVIELVAQANGLAVKLNERQAAEWAQAQAAAQKQRADFDDIKKELLGK